MEKHLYKALITNFPLGYSYNKIIFDEDGQAIDFEYLEVNSAFEKITGLKAKQVINKKFSDIFPNLPPNIEGLIKQVGKDIIEKGVAEFESYFEPFNKYFLINAFSLEKSYFAFVFSDISKRKKTDDALKKSEEALKRQNSLFNTMLKTIPIGIYMVEAPSGKPIIANDAAIDILGRGVLPEVNKTNLAQEYKAFKYKTKKPYPLTELPIIMGMSGISSHVDDMLVQRPDDKQVLLEVFGDPVKDENDKVWASLVSFFDITERKRSEQELIESKLMLNNILNTIPVRVFWKDLNGKYLGCNQHFAKDAGENNPDDIIGKTDYELRWINQADRYTRDDSYIIESGKPKLNFEEPQTTPEGNTIWLNTSKIPLRDNNGKIIGVLGTYEDITEKKLAQEKLHTSEKRYKSLLENAFDGIYMLHGKRFQYVNDRFCEITGYDKKELESGLFDINTLLTEDSTNIIEERYKDRKSGKKVTNIVDFQIITKSGSIKDVQVSNTALVITDEALVLGIMRDVTDLKKAQKLENELAITKQAAEFKQKFLANMSHEIRTPLTGVMGFIELLLKTNLDDTQQNYLDTLKQASNNLKEIINLILDYSKIESGQVQLKPVVFKTKVIATTAENLFSSICNKDISFEANINEDVPEYIKADQQRVIQIINNLISNAVKFTNEGYIKVNISLSKTGLEYDNSLIPIRVEIEDSGIGISKEDQKLLFKPFAQLEKDESRIFEGTGLGLSICKELSEMLGGNIGVESKENVGSKFWFTFNAKRISKEELSSGTTDLNQDMPISTKKLKILLVEDKITNQKVIASLFKSMGHTVEVANNGSEALNIFKPEKYDLIIMDIQMPEMDGVKATQMLKQKFANTPPIIGLSANAFEGDREKYMSLGLDEYMTKPVSSTDFNNMLIKTGLY